VRTGRRIMGGVVVVVLLGVSFFFLYVEVRGGFCQSYAAATFSNLMAAGGAGHAASDLVARTDAGAVRGSSTGSAAASHYH